MEQNKIEFKEKLQNAEPQVKKQTSILKMEYNSNRKVRNFCFIDGCLSFILSAASIFTAGYCFLKNDMKSAGIFLAGGLSITTGTCWKFKEVIKHQEEMNKIKAEIKKQEIQIDNGENQNK